MSHILIVDDDSDLRHVLERFLILKGHQVYSAGNGKAAIALIEKNQIDLVITDILMPDMDGYELISELRHHPAPPRIIAMSGGSGRLDMDYLLRMARTMKVDKLLEKPLKLAIVDAAISEVLGEIPPNSATSVS